MPVPTLIDVHDAAPMIRTGKLGNIFHREVYSSLHSVHYCIMMLSRCTYLSGYTGGQYVVNMQRVHQTRYRKTKIIRGQEVIVARDTTTVDECIGVSAAHVLLLELMTLRFIHA